MQQDSKDRFEQVDKRLDDLKSYLSLGSAIFTVIFAIVSIMFTWNLQSERANLRELEKDLKDEVRTSLGKLDEPPRIEIYTPDKVPLSGQSIDVSFDNKANTDNADEKRKGKVMMSFLCIFKNESSSSSGSIALKLYTRDPLNFVQVSTDEPDFKYEYFSPPEEISPHEMPGGLSIGMLMEFDLETSTIPDEGTYPALLKVFYGKGRIARTTFNLIASHKTQ